MIQENYTGKFISLDIDKKAIIAISSEMDKLMSLVRNIELTGRVYIRKIGTDASTDIPGPKQHFLIVFIVQSCTNN